MQNFITSGSNHMIAQHFKHHPGCTTIHAKKQSATRYPIHSCLSALCLVLISLISGHTMAKSAETVDNLARKGNAALVHQQNHKAIDALSEALVAGPMPIYTKASILNDRALAYSRIKKYELALSDYNQAIEQFPEYAKAYNNRGLLLHQLGFYKEAIKDFNRAIALHPGMGATFHNRANSLVMAGAESSAFKDYGKAVKLLSDKSAPHLARGQLHWSHYRHYAALRELNLALSKNTEQASALYNRGLVYLSLGEQQKAIQDIGKASSVETDNITYKMMLAEIYLVAGQHPNARKLLNQILTDEPLNLEAMILRGRVNFEKGRYNSALDDLNQAVSLSATKQTYTAAAYAERALAYALSDKPALATEDMSAAIHKAPSTARTWAALGEAARIINLSTEAERYYLEALKKDKTDNTSIEGLTILAEQAQAAREAAEAEAAAAALEAVAAAQRAAEQQAAAELRAMEESEAGAEQSEQVQAEENTPSDDSQETLDVTSINKTVEPIVARHIPDVAQPPSDEIVAPEDSFGWTIMKNGNGRYYATSSQYTKLKVILDLFGPNTPKILEWTVLTGKYNGFALLRYDAGNKNTNQPYEHVAVIDLRRQNVISIEPYRWGDKISKWTWNPYDLVVQDPDGIENQIALNAPARRAAPKVARDDSWEWDDGAFWTSGATKKSTGKRRRVRVKKKKKNSLFGIFGF